MKHLAPILCPVCGRIVALKGTDPIGEPRIAWHVRENFKKCEGSGRSAHADQNLGPWLKRPGIRGEQ